jgi:HTH-type transcriptional regulator / antitoxin HigA
VTPGFNDDEYRALLTAYPPRPIEDETQLPGVEERIWELLAIDGRSRAQEAYLTLLSGLVERWENDHVVIPPLTGIELLKVLLADRGLRQKDLTPLFGTESITSEVLSGKRDLQRKHIEGLADFFHVSPAAFFAAREAIGA